MFTSKKKMYILIKSIYIYDRENLYMLCASLYMHVCIRRPALNMANSLSTPRAMYGRISVTQRFDFCETRPRRIYFRPRRTPDVVKTDAVPSTAETVVAEPYSRSSDSMTLNHRRYTVRLSLSERCGFAMVERIRYDTPLRHHESVS